MRYLWMIMMCIVAVIHCLPLLGVLGPEKLESLYQIKVQDPNLEILLRHRAVLFGLVGGFFFVAAFNPKYHFLGLIAGAISVLSFIGLCYSVGGFNAAIARVIMADWIVLGCLVIAALVYWREPNLR